MLCVASRSEPAFAQEPPAEQPEPAAESPIAAEPPATPVEPPAPVALDARLQALEDGIHALDERFVAAPGKGVTLRSLDDSYSLTLRPRIQVRDTFTHNPKDGNELAIKTLRFVFYGNIVVPELHYFVQLAFGSGDYEKDSSSPIYDAYVEYTRLRDLNIKAGQFLVPFDRVRTVREYALQFVDRSLMVRELSLDRDVGLALSSQDLFGTGGRLTYNLYIGSGDGKNRTGAQVLGPLVIARIGVRPFGAFDDDIEGDQGREHRVRLALGVAGAYNAHSPRAQSTLGTTFTLGVADYEHLAADLVFKYAGFSLTAEGLLRHARETGFDGKVAGVTTREWTRSGYGYVVQAGMMVSNYVEVTTRWEQLLAEQITDPTLIATVSTQGRQLGAGVNVYLNGHFLKLQADYFYIWGYAPTSGTHQVRLQLDASF
jgi:hypothetical protein